jgi:hypothetical protein
MIAQVLPFEVPKQVALEIVGDETRTTIYNASITGQNCHFAICSRQALSGMGTALYDDIPIGGHPGQNPTTA